MCTSFSGLEEHIVPQSLRKFTSPILASHPTFVLEDAGEIISRNCILVTSSSSKGKSVSLVPASAAETSRGNIAGKKVKDQSQH